MLESHDDLASYVTEKAEAPKKESLLDESIHFEQFDNS